MKLATATDRDETMAAFDRFTGDSPAISAYFRDHDIAPAGVALIAVQHARAVADNEPSPTIGAMAGLFCVGVVLGIMLTEASE